jgi:hypothetical protein
VLWRQLNGEIVKISGEKNNSIYHRGEKILKGLGDNILVRNLMNKGHKMAVNILLPGLIERLHKRDDNLTITFESLSTNNKEEQYYVDIFCKKGLLNKPNDNGKESRVISIEKSIDNEIICVKDYGNWEIMELSRMISYDYKMNFLMDDNFPNIHAKDSFDFIYKKRNHGLQYETTEKEIEMGHPLGTQTIENTEKFYYREFVNKSSVEIGDVIKKYKYEPLSLTKDQINVLENHWNVLINSFQVDSPWYCKDNVINDKVSMKKCLSSINTIDAFIPLHIEEKKKSYLIKIFYFIKYLTKQIKTISQSIHENFKDIDAKQKEQVMTRLSNVINSTELFVNKKIDFLLVELWKYKEKKERDLKITYMNAINITDFFGKLKDEKYSSINELFDVYPDSDEDEYDNNENRLYHGNELLTGDRILRESIYDVYNYIIYLYGEYYKVYSSINDACLSNKYKGQQLQCSRLTNDLFRLQALEIQIGSFYSYSHKFKFIDVLSKMEIFDRNIEHRDSFAEKHIKKIKEILNITTSDDSIAMKEQLKSRILSYIIQNEYLGTLLLCTTNDIDMWSQIYYGLYHSNLNISSQIKFSKTESKQTGKRAYLNSNETIQQIMNFMSGLKLIILNELKDKKYIDFISRKNVNGMNLPSISIPLMYSKVHLNNGIKFYPHYICMNQESEDNQSNENKYFKIIGLESTTTEKKLISLVELHPLKAYNNVEQHSFQNLYRNMECLGCSIERKEERLKCCLKAFEIHMGDLGYEDLLTFFKVVVKMIYISKSVLTKNLNKVSLPEDWRYYNSMRIKDLYNMELNTLISKKESKQSFFDQIIKNKNEPKKSNQVVDDQFQQSYNKQVKLSDFNEYDLIDSFDMKMMIGQWKKEITFDCIFDTNDLSNNLINPKRLSENIFIFSDNIVSIVLKKELSLSGEQLPYTNINISWNYGITWHEENTRSNYIDGSLISFEELTKNYIENEKNTTQTNSIILLCVALFLLLISTIIFVVVICVGQSKFRIKNLFGKNKPNIFKIKKEKTDDIEEIANSKEFDDIEENKQAFLDIQNNQTNSTNKTELIQSDSPNNIEEIDTKTIIEKLGKEGKLKKIAAIAKQPTTHLNVLFVSILVSGSRLLFSFLVAVIYKPIYCAILNRNILSNKTNGLNYKTTNNDDYSIYNLYAKENYNSVIAYVDSYMISSFFAGIIFVWLAYVFDQSRNSIFLGDTTRKRNVDISIDTNNINRQNRSFVKDIYLFLKIKIKTLILSYWLFPAILILFTAVIALLIQFDNDNSINTNFFWGQSVITEKLDISLHRSFVWIYFIIIHIHQNVISFTSFLFGVIFSFIIFRNKIDIESLLENQHNNLIFDNKSSQCNNDSDDNNILIESKKHKKGPIIVPIVLVICSLITSFYVFHLIKNTWFEFGHFFLLIVSFLFVSSETIIVTLIYVSFELEYNKNPRWQWKSLIYGSSPSLCFLLFSLFYLIIVSPWKSAYITTLYCIYAIICSFILFFILSSISVFSSMIYIKYLFRKIDSKKVD